ncbi:hypothetical protein FHS43_003724 [Streptosporangium becharense]|uniref:Uncharacterized protein n=1 Tax=Streptosporangium becharense TaxID=1816182 RepID=A0A7W9IHV7_9ACTN|nr:hypothetical protein [Streptosporangium becharense]MBB2912441.1 hypothetical protein [Streptosporangium becharense]MBB5820730.1 hypothetical protein [Streptosporangium becharense]
MTGTDHRTALINGLVDLAAFLEANPGVPVPDFPRIYHFADGTDDEIRAEIDVIAGLLGAEISPGDRGYGHYKTTRFFGPVEYAAVGILAHARARRDADTSYAGCVVPDPVTPDIDTDTPAHAA